MTDAPDTTTTEFNPAEFDLDPERRITGGSDFARVLADRGEYDPLSRTLAWRGPGEVLAWIRVDELPAERRVVFEEVQAALDGEDRPAPPAPPAPERT